jgi:hypothetical protein
VTVAAADMASHTALSKRTVAARRRRPPVDSEPLIERVVFRCILCLAVASVVAVLFLSVVGVSP